ncbi:DMT family transporter [Methylobacterium soli]|uniref:Guanidinium exporter n=1 Tax=Methylobacterium soli TaxID=553447 RepID=A0A6L3SUD2_9HYPH|nr:multidrug efflux SMR transporter [Methylobacterium soli]KAB1074997.1 multidrug efflux SMR transporter [Methylobacterium soli]GJE42503.1 Guanidinium exporter [Methylobacterium soli]
MSTGWGWIMLVASGVVDVAWALATKKADGFRDLSWTLMSLLLLALFVWLLTKALQVLPVGTAYAVWTGIGAVGSVGAGILLFGEPADAIRLLFVVVTVLGIIGLRVAS